MYVLNIPSLNNTLTLKFSNEQNLKKYLFWQRSLLVNHFEGSRHQLGYEFSDNKDQNILNFYTDIWRHSLNRKFYDHLPTNPKILDIGSGVSIIDMLAYQYLNQNAKIYLLDKNGDGGGNTYFSTEHGFYHNWDVVEDCISSSNFNRQDFTFLSPEDEWTEDFDLITSWASWTFHYPLDVYWNKVKSHLKLGGKLVIDVSSFGSKESDVIKIISEEFKSEPTIIPLMSKIEGWNTLYDTPTEVANRCIWIRKG